jgi:signal transduction histidine kinase
MPPVPKALTAIRGGRLGLFVEVIQQLSLARDLETIMAIVRSAARELTGADGATFVLHDAGRCYYADEDAIAPLWKGKRFPMEACISGWSMIHREAVAIPDIYADRRIPADAYRPTFVKSLAMVPIRIAEPIGAIGNYWATPHAATLEEIDALQALANCTSVAMENVAIVSDVEARVRLRTEQLEATLRDLDAFSYAISHDLRAPVRRIDGFAQAIEEDAGGQLDAQSQRHLQRVREAARTMNQYIDDMLSLAKVGRDAVRRDIVDLSALARSVFADVARSHPGREVEQVIADGVQVQGDQSLLRGALENLVGNAFKFTARVPHARVEVGRADREGETAYYVRDNGAGFDMQFAPKLFAPFQRLHRAEDFPGTGIGLATVKKSIARHDGRIWAESTPGSGATFWFTIPRPVV